MQEKIRQLESFEREIGALEGARIEINVTPESELHKEIRSMKHERKLLKGTLFF